MTASPIHLILLGSMMFVVGFVLWRNSILRHRSARRRPHQEAIREINERSQLPDSRIRESEIRLHDFDREVSARVSNTLNVLDKLVIDAMRESEHLEQLIEQANQLGVGPKLFQPEEEQKLSADQQSRCAKLLGLGLSVDEIARALMIPEELVISVKNEGTESDRDAA